MNSHMWKVMVWTVHMPLPGPKFTIISKEKKIGFFDQLSENSALPAGMVKVKITNKILSGSLDDLWTFLFLV